MNEISLNGKKICLKVSILFKTDTLPKMLAPHNAHLVKLNHSYIESIFLGPDHFDITKFSCTWEIQIRKKNSCLFEIK